MKTEVKEESMVAQLRKIRDQIGIEIQDMNPEQVVAYFNNQKGFLPKELFDKAKQQKTALEQSDFDNTKDCATVGPPREG